MQVLQLQQRFVTYMNVLTELVAQSAAFPYEFLGLSTGGTGAAVTLAVSVVALQ